MKSLFFIISIFSIFSLIAFILNISSKKEFYSSPPPPPCFPPGKLCKDEKSICKLDGTCLSLSELPTQFSCPIGSNAGDTCWNNSSAICGVKNEINGKRRCFLLPSDAKCNEILPKCEGSFCFDLNRSCKINEVLWGNVDDVPGWKPPDQKPGFCNICSDDTNINICLDDEQFEHVYDNFAGTTCGLCIDTLGDEAPIPYPYFSNSFDCLPDSAFSPGGWGCSSNSECNWPQGTCSPSVNPSPSIIPGQPKHWGKCKCNTIPGTYPPNSYQGLACETDPTNPVKLRGNPFFLTLESLNEKVNPDLIPDIKNLQNKKCKYSNAGPPPSNIPQCPFTKVIGKDLSKYLEKTDNRTNNKGVCLVVYRDNKEIKQDMLIIDKDECQTKLFEHDADDVNIFWGQFRNTVLKPSRGPSPGPSPGPSRGPPSRSSTRPSTNHFLFKIKND